MPDSEGKNQRGYQPFNEGHTPKETFGYQPNSQQKTPATNEPKPPKGSKDEDA